MKMKRILNSLRPSGRRDGNPGNSGQGTGDLTGGRQASLDDSGDHHDNSNNHHHHRRHGADDYDDDELETLYSTTGESRANVPVSDEAYKEVERFYASSNNSEATGQTATSTTAAQQQQQQSQPSLRQQQQQPENKSAGDRCDETRTLVKKFISDIWNRGELDLIPSVCSPSLRFNGNTGFDRVGHDGLARMVATIRHALDEYHCEIHSMVVEDNKAFCRLRFTGKHVGPLMNYAPTNKTVAWMGATEFTCQNGRILKVWELGDVESLKKQLEEQKVDEKVEDEM